MSSSNSVNLLLVKVGTEPGLESIPTEIKRMNPNVKTFGVLNTLDQEHEFDIVVTSSHEACLGAHPEYFSENLFVRPEIYSELSKVEGQALRIYERVAIHDLTKVKHPAHPIPDFNDSVDDRSQLFLRQVAFWDWALTHHQIQAVVAQNYGHVGWDLVLQNTAKTLGIPYLFFHEVRPFLKSLYVHEEVNQIGDLKLGRELIRGAQNNNWYKGDSPHRREVMAEQLGLTTGTLVGGDSHSLGFVPRLWSRIGDPRSLPTRLSKSIQRRARNSGSVADERRAITVGPLPKNYVFCELQSQPNATTAVKGWTVPDQRESLAMIAKYLPPGWRLVVKESDRQWSRMYPRRKNFWSHIAAIPNVCVVASTEDTNSLARGSKVVVETSYSTIALDAIKRGTPIIVFGYSHIAHLPGVHPVRCEQDVADAMMTLCGDAPTRSSVDEVMTKLEIFLQETKSATIEGALSSMPKFSSSEEKSRYLSQLATNVAGVISCWLATKNLDVRCHLKR